MKITLTGSLGNISKPLAEILIKKGHEWYMIHDTLHHRNTIPPAQLGLKEKRPQH